MLECHSIKVDNSSLTGESVPVSLKPDTCDPNHLESKNLAFYSTNVVEGQGRGVVVKTGDHTVMGCIAHLVTTIDSGKTPINKEISKFVHLITAIALAIGLVFFIIAMSMKYDLIQSIVFVIGIIVANVPEVSGVGMGGDRRPGSADHRHHHPYPHGPADGKEELPGEEPGGGGDPGYGRQPHHLSLQVPPASSARTRRAP